MYVYVNRKIDKIMTIASQRGKINLKGEKGEESSALGPEVLDERLDDTRESVGIFTHLSRVIPCRKGDHRWDL